MKKIIVLFILVFLEVLMISCNLDENKLEPSLDSATDSSSIKETESDTVTDEKIIKVPLDTIDVTLEFEYGDDTPKEIADKAFISARESLKDDYVPIKQSGKRFYDSAKEKYFYQVRTDYVTHSVAYGVDVYFYEFDSSDIKLLETKRV